MNDKIKTHLTTAYMMFVFEFCDPSSVDKDQIESSLNQKLDKIFDTQKCADRARKLWGKVGFRKIISVYFHQYQTKHGVDIGPLEETLLRNKKVFLRHLGKDKVTFLLLIVTLVKSLEDHKPRPKQGLLAQRLSA